jgi:hypothetical protein
MLPGIAACPCSERITRSQGTHSVSKTGPLIQPRNIRYHHSDPAVQHRLQSTFPHAWNPASAILHREVTFGFLHSARR